MLVVRDAPGPMHRAVADPAAVEAQRVIRKVVRGADGVNEAPGHVLLLGEAHRLALPDPDRAGPVGVADARQLSGDLLQGLLQGDFLPAGGGALEGLPEPVGMVHQVDGRAPLAAQPPAVPGVLRVAVDVHDPALFQVDIDGAVVVAHAAEGLEDLPGLPAAPGHGRPPWPRPSRSLSLASKPSRGGRRRPPRPPRTAAPRRCRTSRTAGPRRTGRTCGPRGPRGRSGWPRRGRPAGTSCSRRSARGRSPRPRCRGCAGWPRPGRPPGTRASRNAGRSRGCRPAPPGRSSPGCWSPAAGRSRPAGRRRRTRSCGRPRSWSGSMVDDAHGAISLSPAGRGCGAGRGTAGREPGGLAAGRGCVGAGRPARPGPPACPAPRLPVGTPSRYSSFT